MIIKPNTYSASPEAKRCSSLLASKGKVLHRNDDASGWTVLREGHRAGRFFATLRDVRAYAEGANDSLDR